jgi:hypothetical protein
MGRVLDTDRIQEFITPEADKRLPGRGLGVAEEEKPRKPRARQCLY